MTQISPLDILAQRLKAQYEAEKAKIEAIRTLIQSLRTALEQNPEYRSVLAEELRLLVGDAPKETPAPAAPGDDDEDLDPDPEDDLSEAEDEQGTDEPGVTVAHRLISYFCDRENAPASIQMIAAATRAKATTLRGVLYKPKRNKGRFVRVEGYGDGQETYWRLTPGIYSGHLAALAAREAS